MMSSKSQVFIQAIAFKWTRIFTFKTWNNFPAKLQSLADYLYRFNFIDKGTGKHPK